MQPLSSPSLLGAPARRRRRRRGDGRDLPQRDGKTAQRAQLIKLAGASCTRGGSDGALRIAVGKATDACSYRTPVLGRDLEIAATERLLSGTPTALQRKAYLGLELRAGAGAKYQLLVFPLQRKVQLVKVTPKGPNTWRSSRTSKS